MWLWRLAGVLMLACSGLTVSQRLNRRAAAALAQVEGFMKLIRTVRGQIACFSRPIGEILGTCESEVLLACGYLEGRPPRDLCELVAHSHAYDLPTMHAVSDFVREFGHGYRADEVRVCDYALSLLEERRALLARELPQRKKQNIALSVCVSLALAVLLL